MRKCASFPSLVVLKHIHMSSMFPFLLLPLCSLAPLLFLFSLHEGWLWCTDGGCDPLEWCFPIVKLLTLRIRGAESFEGTSTVPEILDVQSQKATDGNAHTNVHGEAFSRVWATLFFISLAPRLTFSHSFSFSFSRLEKSDLF